MDGVLKAYLKTTPYCDEEMPEGTITFDFRDAFKYYDHIASKAGLPSGSREGNGYEIVKYPANGEAADWMLGVRGIYAMSPELGTSFKGTEEFFPYYPETVVEILSKNYPYIKYTMLYLQPEKP